MDAENKTEDVAGDDKETALLPSSLFGGECKVGDTYRVKVVAKFDDELEVEHAPDKKKEDSESEGSMDGAMKGIDSMAESNQAY